MGTTTTEIPPIDVNRAPLLARPYLQNGGSLAAMLAHVPELLEATMPFVSVVLGPSQLGERLKHLVILRTSVLGGCRYCTRVYRDTATDYGVSPAEAAALCASEPDLSPFAEREAIALTFVETFSRNPAASVAPLHAVFRADEIVALVTIAGTTVFLNRFATALSLA